MSTSFNVNGAINFTGNDRIDGTLSLPNVPLTVANGGTGIAAATAYAPICSGATSTAALQVASTGMANSGFILTSNGSSAIPSFQAASSGAIVVTSQVFTGNGTYTPTAGMTYCLVDIVAGGGGGGGAGAGTGQSVGGGGGAGAYARSLFTAAQIGASKAVTIGSAGSAGTDGNDGGTGGSSSLGTLVVVAGGLGGVGGDISTVWQQVLGGAGGAVSTGGNIFDVSGQYGEPGVSAFKTTAASEYIILTGTGGSTPLGRGGAGGRNTSGSAATGYGSGGGGGGTVGAGNGGGAGAGGICIITEFK
jgi:hypothetical protein